MLINISKFSQKTKDIVNKNIPLLIVFLLICSHISASYKETRDRSVAMGQTDDTQKHYDVKGPIVNNGHISDQRSLWHQFNNNQESTIAKKAFGWAVKQSALLYGTTMAISTGHQLGYNVIPWICGAQTSIKINLNMTASGKLQMPPNASKMLIPLTVAMGPIGGIITSLGILRITNIYEEYKKSMDIQVAFKNGTRKPFINKDQPIGIQAAAICALVKQPLDYISADNFNTDGNLITHWLNLHGIKARIARGSMATAALGIGACMISKDCEL